jgi:hypothetical protein
MDKWGWGWDAAVLSLASSVAAPRCPCALGRAGPRVVLQCSGSLGCCLIA